MRSERSAAAPSKPIRLTVRLTPRGGRDAVEGWTRDASGSPCLKVRVAAPPVEGEANAALETLIAGLLKIGRGSVRIVSGQQGRVKRIDIDVTDEAALDRAFGTPD